MYLNKVFLLGNLTRDPELKSLPSGMQVCNFGLATNRTYKDRDGNKQEQTEFHNVVAFGRSAELVAQYMQKGRQLYIEGRLQTRSWDQDGQKRYRTEVIVDQFQFGDSKQGGGTTQQSGAPTATSASEPASSGDAIEYPDEEINPDDIPF